MEGVLGEETWEGVVERRAAVAQRPVLTCSFSVSFLVEIVCGFSSDEPYASLASVQIAIDHLLGVFGRLQICRVQGLDEARSTTPDQALTGTR